MRVENTEIADVKIIHLDGFTDPRGMFFETFDLKKFEALGLPANFVMDATSQNLLAGTLRGLHYQAPSHAQGKLVRASRGRALDVALDIRHGSSTFGQHVAVTLSEQDLFWFYIPAGFAHGFCTLEDNTEIIYKLSGHYEPEASKGILWNDSELGINWPVTSDEALLVDKDRALPKFSETVSGFEIKGEGV